MLQQLLKSNLPNTKRFCKWNRKLLQNSPPFCLNEMLVKKTGYILLKTITILAIEFW